MPRLINPPNRALMYLAGRHNRRQPAPSHSKQSPSADAERDAGDVRQLLADPTLTSLQRARTLVDDDTADDLVVALRQRIRRATAIDSQPAPDPELQTLLKLSRHLPASASVLVPMAIDDLVPILNHSRINKDLRLLCADVFLDIVHVVEDADYDAVRLFDEAPAWIADLQLNDYGRAALITAAIADERVRAVDLPLFRRLLQFAFAHDVRLRSMSLTALTTFAVRFATDSELGPDAVADLIMEAVLYNWDRAFHKIRGCTGPLVDAVFSLLRMRTPPEFCLRLYRSLAPGRAKWLLLSTMLEMDQLASDGVDLLPDLIAAAGSPTSWSVVHPLAGRLLTKLSATLPPDEFIQAWLPPLVSALTSNDALALDHLKSDLLPILMRIDRGALASLTATLPASASAALAAAAIGARRAGIEFDEVTAFADLGCLFRHSDLGVVAEAFAVVCTSSRKSTLPNAQECDLAAACMKRFRNLSMSALRHKVDHYLQQLLLRIRAGAQRCRKSDLAVPASPFTNEGPCSDSVVVQYRFVGSLLETSLQNIFPGACPDRLLTNLQIIYVITDIWPDWQDLDGVDRLLAALSSTWNTIRNASLAVLYKLQEYHGLIPGYTSPEQLTPLLTWALSLLSSSQPSYTQSGSVLAQFLFKVYVIGRGWTFDSSWTLRAAARQNTGSGLVPILISYVERNVAELEQTSIMERYRHERHRLHGILLLLADLITEPGSGSDRFVERPRPWLTMARVGLNKDLAGDLVQICRRVLAVSMDVHSNQSGHEHWGLLEIESIDCRGHVVLKDDDDSAQAQLLVVCSWHAIKQSCNVLAALVRSGILAIDVVRSIGDSLIDVLYFGKHQGVLLNTFLSLEAVAANVPVDLLQQWLDRLLADVQAGDSGQWIRRSAGVPFCFRAFLHAVRGHIQRRMTERILDALLEIASAVDQEWQIRVHALNVVRALIGDASLTNATVARIAAIMSLAISGFDSPDWALRNSSLMLFTSSVKMSCSAMTTGRSFFTAHPDLCDFFLQRLIAATRDCSLAHDSSLHPILLLLSRLQHCMSSIDKLSLFQPYIERCAAHPNYLIRQQAARALPVTLRNRKHFAETLLRTRLRKGLSANHIHGLFLKLLYLTPELESPIDPEAIAYSLHFCGPESTCFVVRRCALQTFAALLLPTSSDPNVFMLIRYAIDAFLLESDSEFGGIGYHRLRETAANVLVQFETFLKQEQRNRLVTVALRSCPNVVRFAIEPNSLPSDFVLELVLLQSLHESPLDFTRLLELAFCRDGINFNWHQELRRYIVHTAASLTDPNALRLLGRMQRAKRDVEFLDVVGLAISPDQQADCRAAACDALIHAGIPEQEEDAISYWLHVLDLIVDDDEQIRMSACQHLVPSGDDTARSDPLSSLFYHLRLKFGCSSRLSLSLRSRILQFADVHLSMTSSSAVFIVDKRNEYLEPLLLVQHIAVFVKESFHKFSSLEQEEWTRAVQFLIINIDGLKLSSYQSKTVDEVVLQCLYTTIAMAHAVTVPITNDVLCTIANIHHVLRDLCESKRMFLLDAKL